MMKWTRSWLLWIAIGPAVLTTVPGPQNHTRTVHAKRIINDRDMWSFSLDRTSFWQSSHQLLYNRISQQPSSDGGTASDKQAGWTLIDITNDKSVLLKGLSDKHLQDFDGEVGAHAALSPDGKWLLSYGFAGMADSGSMYGDVSMLDGSHHRRLHPVRYGKICWLDDSRHWLEWDADTSKNRLQRILVHSVSSNAVQELRLPRRIPLHADDVIRMASLQRCLAQIGVPAVDRNGFISISEWDLRKPGSAKRTFKIHLGKGVKVSEVRLSSGGERAAFLLPPQHGGPWRIRVSALDGTKMHDVVGLPYVINDAEFLIERLDWSPDGKRLSFYYDGFVWVVPAD